MGWWRGFSAARFCGMASDEREQISGGCGEDGAGGPLASRWRIRDVTAAV